MIAFIENLFQMEVLITALVGFAAFGTVLTIAAPYFEGDKLNARIKGVSMERDRLRAQQKAQLIGGEARLREKPKRSLVSQVVEALNLRSVFAAEASREALLMQVLGGFSCAEISSALGTSEGAVMTRLTRTRQALRRRLAPPDAKGIKQA